MSFHDKGKAARRAAHFKFKLASIPEIMRRPPPVFFFALLLMACVIVGCRTTTIQSSSLPNPDADYVGYKQEPPVWLFIPLVHLFDTPRGGYPAEIARQPRTTYTTNRIEVTVQGTVLSPGLLRLPERCTVLQAVSFAGGFAECAYTKKVFVTNRNQITRILYLHFRRAPISGHRVAWYGGPSWSGNDSETDYVLEDGDIVVVKMTM